MTWPESARFDQLEFHLESICTRNRLQKVQHETGKAMVRLYADALLHPDFEYQLTWKCRSGNSVSPAFVRFRFQPPLQPGTPGVDSRPPELRTELPKQFYLCEILFRDQNALFLEQTILPRLNPYDFSMAAVSFSTGGESLDPPDPDSSRSCRNWSDLIPPIPFLSRLWPTGQATMVRMRVRSGTSVFPT